MNTETKQTAMSGDESSDASFVSNETTIHYHGNVDISGDQDSSIESSNIVDLTNGGSSSEADSSIDSTSSIPNQTPPQYQLNGHFESLSVVDSATAPNSPAKTISGREHSARSSLSANRDDSPKFGGPSLDGPPATHLETAGQPFLVPPLSPAVLPQPGGASLSLPPSHSARTSPVSHLSNTPPLAPTAAKNIHHSNRQSQNSINSMLVAAQSPGLRPSSAQSLGRPTSGQGMPNRPVRSRTPLRPMSSRSSFSSFDFTGNYSDHTPNSGTPTFGPASHSRHASMASFYLNETASQYASASMFDLNQSYLTPHFGDDMKGSLMPRIQTIELYRKNAKKSHDPVIQFQFAQYMLQTALLSGTAVPKSPTKGDWNPNSVHSDSASNLSSPSLPPSRATSPSKKSHLADKLPGADNISEQEKKIKAELLKEAIANLRKLADKGYADAQYLLGDAYASGALGKPDLKESFSMFQLAAKHGHGEAAYRAALCLEEGWGTAKDVRRATQFLRTAASRNQPGAMLRLGLACFYGKMGLARNSKVQQEGIKWLTRAAESANEVYPQAPYELAKIYEAGYKDIVFSDHQYAAQLYVKSAELNYIPAATIVGQAYEYGKLGCPQDAALSIHYYTIAALGGDPKAMLAMCAWYMVGAEPVLPRNEEEAYEWAIRAAQRGLSKAQFAVGYFMENGIGVERDILQSTNWYRKAAEGGDRRAIERLDRSKKASAVNETKKKDTDCIIM